MQTPSVWIVVLRASSFVSLLLVAWVLQLSTRLRVLAVSPRRQRVEEGIEALGRVQLWDGCRIDNLLCRAGRPAPRRPLPRLLRSRVRPSPCAAEVREKV